jgi:hypothetical protein
MESFLTWLASTAMRRWLEAQAPWLWPIAETFHFIGMSLLIGIAGFLDVRLMGFMKRVPIAAVKELMPIAIAGFVLNVVSGLYFWLASPLQYYQNPMWWWKTAFIVLAGLNVIVFESVLNPQVVASRPGEDTTPLLKTAGAVSLFSWLAVLYFGRMIAFISE